MKVLPEGKDWKEEEHWLHRLIFLLEDQDKAGVLRWLTGARETRETILNTSEDEAND